MGQGCKKPGPIPEPQAVYGREYTGLGVGTFGLDMVPPEAVAKAVGEALRLGCRLVDCASCYGNGRVIGKVLKDEMAKGRHRESLFVVGKAWNDCHAPEKLIASCKQTLENLSLDSQWRKPVRHLRL